MKTRLTKRELEVLTLIADGLSNKVIARTLEIAVPTVKIHIRNMFVKLKVRNRTQAALAFLQKRYR